MADRPPRPWWNINPPDPAGGAGADAGGGAGAGAGDGAGLELALIPPVGINEGIEYALTLVPQNPAYQAPQVRNSSNRLRVAPSTVVASPAPGLLERLQVVGRAALQKLAIPERLGQLTAWIRKPAKSMTLFRLIISQNSLAHGAKWELNQTPDLKRFLDAKLLADDEASLRLQDIALRQLAQTVLHYMKYYKDGTDSEIIIAEILKNFIYWRSVANFHKAVKSRVIQATLGISVMPGTSMEGELIIRPPSVVSWGGKRIAELDNEDARLILAIFAEVTPPAAAPLTDTQELMRYLLATLGLSAEDLNEKAILNPERWTPPGILGDADAARPQKVEELIVLLNNIPDAVRRLQALETPVWGSGVLRAVGFTSAEGVAAANNVGSGVDPGDDSLEARLASVGGPLTEGNQSQTPLNWNNSGVGAYNRKRKYAEALEKQLRVYDEARHPFAVSRRSAFNAVDSAGAGAARANAGAARANAGAARANAGAGAARANSGAGAARANSGAGAGAGAGAANSQATEPENGNQPPSKRPRQEGGRKTKSNRKPKDRKSKSKSKSKPRKSRKTRKSRK